MVLGNLGMPANFQNVSSCSTALAYAYINRGLWYEPHYLHEFENAAQPEFPESPEPESTPIVPAGVATKTTAIVRDLKDCSCISPHDSPAHSSRSSPPSLSETLN